MCSNFAIVTNSNYINIYINYLYLFDKLFQLKLFQIKFTFAGNKLMYLFKQGLHYLFITSHKWLNYILLAGSPRQIN